MRRKRMSKKFYKKMSRRLSKKISKKKFFKKTAMKRLKVNDAYASRGGLSL